MAEEKKQKFAAAEAKGGPGGGGPHARGGFQKPKDTKKTIKRLLTYITTRKSLLVLIGVFLIISAVASTAGTYILRPVINNLVSDAGWDEKLRLLLRGCILLFAVQAAEAVCTYCSGILTARMAHKAVNGLRADLFEALESKPLKYFDAHPHGELMSRFTNDADNVSFAMEQSFVNLITSALSFIGVVIMMLYTAPILFPITILILAATLLAFKALGKRSRIYYRKQQAALGQVNGEIQEIIEGLKVVKAFTHEDIAKAEFAELNEAYRVAATDANFYGMSIMPMSANIMNIGYALTAVAGGFLALVRGFDLGGLAAYLLYTRQVGRPIEQMGQQVNTILSALAGAERIFEVMDAPAEIDEGQVTLERLPDDADAGNASTEHWVWRKPDGTAVPLRGDVRLEHVDFSYVEGRGRRSPLWAPPAPARPPSPTSSTVSMRSSTAPSPMTASTSGTSRRTPCAALWAPCCRTPTSSPARSWTTSATGGWTPRTRNASPRRRAPTPTASSDACRTAIRPW